MDIQSKSHALLNYTIGGTAATSPWWMQLIDITDPVIHWLTGLIGLAIVIIQLNKNITKK